MDEEIFNMSLRNFLKKVGITAQREIENTIRGDPADGTMAGDGKVAAKAVITLEGFDEQIVVTSDIEIV